MRLPPGPKSASLVCSCNMQGHSPELWSVFSSLVTPTTHSCQSRSGGSNHYLFLFKKKTLANFIVWKIKTVLKDHDSLVFPAVGCQSYSVNLHPEVKIVTITNCIFKVFLTTKMWCETCLHVVLPFFALRVTVITQYYATSRLTTKKYLDQFFIHFILEALE